MSKGVFFEPWVGSEYEKGINGRRIMVLGHNHYCDKKPKCVYCRTSCRTFTINIIKEYLQKPFYDSKDDSHRWKLTFNAFEKAWFGQTISNEKRNDLWKHLLFYNLIQEAMPDSNTQPTAKQYKDAEAPFRSILSTYTPNVILVWGNGAYNHTPNDSGVPIEPIEYEDQRSIGWRYLCYNEPIDIFKIHHPARSFSYIKWHNIITRIINGDYACK